MSADAAIYIWHETTDPAAGYRVEVDGWEHFAAVTVDRVTAERVLAIATPLDPDAVLDDAAAGHTFEIKTTPDDAAVAAALLAVLTR